MRNVPPPLNELATRLVVRSCVAAIVALPLLGLSALAGQATDETDIGPSHLTVAGWPLLLHPWVLH